MAKQKFTKLKKFTIIKKIAHGGMAEIFLACVGSIKLARRFVVLKKILAAHHNNKDFSKMFQNEVKIVANLNHSNMASIYDFGIDNDQYFICMEYISGRNLRQFLKKLSSQKKSPSIPHSAHIIKNICSGLEYAHNYTNKLTGKPLNIIHRDISPQNIMISFNGEIKLIDFGIAKAMDTEATKAGVLKGKFEYMSPEQVRGKPLNNQTDIFSLGTVLWELLAGQKLFTAGDEWAVLRKIKECRLPNLKKLNPKIPNRIIEIVNKALQPNKNIRYKTASDMENDLSVFLNKEYPNFTSTNFNKFIKDTYIEEILEERNFLKQCADTLDQSDKTQKTDLNQLTRTWRAQSSALYDDDDMGQSQFIGYTTDTNTNSQPGDRPPHTYTESEVTAAQKTSPRRAEDITKTKFDDLPLLNPKKPGQSQLKKNLKENSRPPDSLNTLSKKFPTANTYNPYRTNTSMPRTNYQQLALRRAQQSRRRLLFFFCVLAGLGGGGWWFQEPLLKTFTADNLWAAINLINPSKEDPQAKNRPPASVKKPKQAPARQRQNLRTVTVKTQPSGADIYINKQKQIDTTPASISLERGKVFKITVEKKGYHRQTRTISSKLKANTITLTLKKNDQYRGGNYDFEYISN